MSVLIIDYGMGNLGSVKRAFEECGANAFLSTDPKELSEASHIVLPGVGAFSDGMKHLNENGWVAPLKKTLLEDKIPLLGICLGMQLLAETGTEGGETKGLGLIEGEILKLEPTHPDERIPHIGWNEVTPKNNHTIFQDIQPRTDFYFVHSFHFKTKNPENIIATTPYCNEFVSAVRKDNIFGTQFHPEKSSKPGFQLIKNFLNYA